MTDQPPLPDFTQAAPKLEGLKAGADIAKQLITLSVGMIGLTVTFLKDIVEPVTQASRGVPWMMVVAWSAYVVCILGSVATLMGICGTMTVLDRLAMKLPIDDRHQGAYDVYQTTVRIPMLVMVLGFIVAIGFTVAAAAIR
jgi:hypothetical protein